MNHYADNDKLSRLRARTDVQLIAIIRKNLETGLHLASQAADDDRARARSAWAEASLLLPHTGMSEADRRHFNGQVERLRQALDGSRREWTGKFRAAGT
jgi:hypothetical protein